MSTNHRPLYESFFKYAMVRRDTKDTYTASAFLDDFWTEFCRIDDMAKEAEK